LIAYDNREFADDDTRFSSFAQLIGITRGVASVLTLLAEMDAETLSRLSKTLDAVTGGWLMLLPVSKRNLSAEGGQGVDELMFQAHMVLHT